MLSGLGTPALPWPGWMDTHFFEELQRFPPLLLRSQDHATIHLVVRMFRQF